MSPFRFPNESKEYRARRDALLEAEVRLREQVEAVAQQRRELPLGGKLGDDYVFQRRSAGGDIVDVPFDELFGEHDQLIIYSLMFGDEWDAPCPSCTSIVDGLEANYIGVTRLSSMAVVADANAAKLADWSEQRGWNRIPVLSGRNNSFLLDYAAFEDANSAAVVSALNSFRRTPEGIFHHWGCELSGVPFGENGPRHVDMIWPLWNLLDITPGGRGRFGVPRQDYKHEYFTKNVYSDD